MLKKRNDQKKNENSEIEVLKKENKILKEMLKNYKESNARLKDTVERMRVEETDKAVKLRALQKNYIQVISEFEEMKQKYQKEIETLCKNIKKDTN